MILKVKLTADFLLNSWFETREDLPNLDWISNTPVSDEVDDPDPVTDLLDQHLENARWPAWTHDGDWAVVKLFSDLILRIPVEPTENPDIFAISNEYFEVESDRPGFELWFMMNYPRLDFIQE